MDFVLRSSEKAIEDHGIKRRGKTVGDLDYADDLSILEKNMNQMNELLNFLRV